MFPQLRKLQLMTAALLVSGGVNVALSAGLWRSMQHRPALRSAQLPRSTRELDVENRAIVDSMRDWEYARLLAELSNQSLACDGFTRAGLALSVLIERFGFDVDRALMGKALQHRVYVDGGDDRRVLIAGLCSSDFEQIQRFGRQEQWPITERTLFQLVKSHRVAHGPQHLAEIDPTLLEAFFASEAFCSFARLFPSDLPRQCLASAALDLTWEEIGQIDRAEYGVANARRCELLLRALARGGREAAYLLITSDPDFALHRVSDDAMCQLLTAMDTYTAEAMTVALTVLKGPRSDRVRELAAKRACHFLNLPQPTSEAQLGLLARAIAKGAENWPEGTLDIASTMPSQPGELQRAMRVSEYVVRPGDTLWKLSKTYGLSVADLMRRNGLTRDFLQIGQILHLDLSSTAL